MPPSKRSTLRRHPKLNVLCSVLAQVPIREIGKVPPSINIGGKPVNHGIEGVTCDNTRYLKLPIPAQWTYSKLGRYCSLAYSALGDRGIKKLRCGEYVRMGPSSPTCR